VKIAMTASSINPPLVLVGVGGDRGKPRAARRRKSAPALPRQISSALNGLASGELDCVFVAGCVARAERSFSVSAGMPHELFDIFYKPFITPSAPEVNGNVITIQKPITAEEQIIAVGEAFSAGRLSSLHLVIRHADGKTENKRLK
jgi:hypothetical protein